MSHSAIKRAFDARRKAQEELRSIYDAAEGRDLSAEERSAEEALVADIKEISNKEMELINLAEQEARAAEYFAASVASEAPAVAEARGSLADELRSIGLGLTAGVSHVEFRDDVALVKGSATDGAELVDSELSKDLVSFLEEKIGAVQAGARVLRTSGGADIVMPKVSSFTSVSGVVAEGGTIGRSAPQFETVTLGAKKVGVLVQASRELLEDAAFPFVPFIVEQATEQIARNMGSEFMLGTNITAGLVDATANTVTTAGAAVTADELFDVYHAIVSGYRSNATWIMNDATIAAVRKLKDSDGQYIWNPGIAAGRPDTILGRPVVADDAMAAQASLAKSIVFGDISKAYTARMVNALDVARSDEYAFDTDLVTWRFVARFDGALVDEKAVVVVDNT